MSRSLFAVESRAPGPGAEWAQMRREISRVEWMEPTQVDPRPLFSVPMSPPAPAPALADAPEAAVELEELRRSAEHEGLMAAQHKVEALAQRYLDAVARLEEQSRRGVRPLASEVVELALVVARELVGRELSLDRDALVGGLDEALASASEDQQVTVRIGPTDLAYLRKRRPDLSESKIAFVEDVTLTIGGCVVETTQRVVDRSIEARLESVREALTTLLDRPEAATADEVEVEETPAAEERAAC